MRYVAIAIIMLLSTLGPSAAIALVGFSAVKALGRNPAAAPRIMTAMIVSFVCAESVAVIALLVTYNIFR